ncbi:MAG: nucleotidyl transferase AbiEii/AbiGii toxin family protein [Chloroflexota bacterium]
MNNLYEQQIAFGSVIDILEAIDASYAIWGGIAVMAFGEPRFTHDMDILLNGESLLIPQIIRRLQESHVYVDTLSVEKAAFQGSFFNVIHQAYQIKVDLYVPNEPRLKQMIVERVKLPFDEMRDAHYVSAESLIIAKMIAFKDSQSTRHIDDIAAVVRVQAKKLDLQKVTQAAVDLSLFGVWQAILEQNA